MAHPDRRLQRRRKKEKKEEGLARKTDLGYLDLTPHNAVKVINFNSEAGISFK